MRTTTVFMFPGQGAQYEGMGAELYDKYPECVDMANQILGYDIRKLTNGELEKSLHFTRYTQPALFVVNSLYYRDIVNEMGVPDIVLGHSLGEYNALLAANVIDFKNGLMLVKRRAELMSGAPGGGMSVVMQLDIEAILNIINVERKQGTVGIANINSEMQIVLSGDVEVLAKLKKELENNGAIVMELQVSGAFHSTYMEPVALEYNKHVKKTDFKNQDIPVISNVTAEPYLDEDISEVLIRQLYSTVNWSGSIKYLLDKYEKIDFIEVGPGRVLSGLLRYIKKEWKNRAITDGIGVG